LNITGSLPYLEVVKQEFISGLRRTKNRSLQEVNEDFEFKRNAKSTLFGDF
jgi:hypothetical protein